LGAFTDPLFNLNPVAIDILQLQLPNGNYAIPGSGAPLGNGNAGYATTTFSDPASFQGSQRLRQL
jgi:hypothetical protein